MKNLLKRFLKLLWNATGFVRRPIQRKLEGYAHRLAAQMINAHLPSVLGKMQSTLGSSAYDSNLLLNSLLREVARLQMQVEVLQHYAEEAHMHRAELAIVDGSNESESSPYDQHMKVG